MPHRTLVIGSRLHPDPAHENERQQVVDRLALALEVACYAIAAGLLTHLAILRILAFLS